MLSDLKNVFVSIWTFIDDITIPVINISMGTFLLSVMLISTLIVGINFILNKPGGSDG